jgi:MinD-like ATPase involved in chromosome partitioning or flagellar assembly
MRVLIVDNTTESQALCAKRIEGFSKADKEMLDLKVRLVNERDFIERLSEADVLIFGSHVSDQAVSLARQARMEAPWIQIVMFVGDREYGGGAFRSAHSVGVRKVFPESAGALDLLQELVAIHADFRKEGRTYEGRIVVVMHAKGGVGATSIAAALGEVCGGRSRRTMLWDLDVETKDLSRALSASGPESKIISGWVNGSRDINRETFRDALIPLDGDVSILTPPDRFAESMDLVCHADGMEISHRIVELAKVLFDVIIVDSGGRMGPALGGILRSADVVLMVTDDSELGLTAVDLLLASVKPLIGGTERLRFLVNPSSERPIELRQISSNFDAVHTLNPEAWVLPVLSREPKVSAWPGTGNTLYSLGSKELRSVFGEIAEKLGLVERGDESQSTKNADGGRGESSNSPFGWVSRLFRRRSESELR